MRTLWTFTFLMIFLLGFNNNKFSYVSITSQEKPIVLTSISPTDPAVFYKKQCAFCHAGEEMIAPDMKKIKNLYLKKYPQKQDFIQAIVNFASSPSKDKVVYKEALKKFTLMPKMPFKKEDLKSVAAYIYDKI